MLDTFTAQTGLLLLITLVAAIVNGALGYGFSSITVPLALLFLSFRPPAIDVRSAQNDLPGSFSEAALACSMR